MSDAAMKQSDPRPSLEGEALVSALREHFGYQAFRPGQESIVRSVLGGRPTIAILPTGGGKSLCYQLPALLLPGTTVVVSPLVALMKDQVDALNARGVQATFINSSLSESERSERQVVLRRGGWRLVYVAPERFRSNSFLQSMAQVHCPLLAVDEAHCISAWGHDFRPDYQRLSQARTQLSAERVLALTATATPEVRRDIASALQMQDPRIFVAGFDRPNLFIEVDRVSGDREKLGRIFALARKGEPGLIYAATRKNVEKVVAAMRAAGLQALAYHAGLEDEQRSAVQDAFVRGEVPVVVATNAFGMGVDKPDIRFVAHFDVPRSLEAYYQEIGRAGRDGQPSIAVLLFNYADVLMQRRMIESSYSEPGFVRRVWEEARRSPDGRSDAIARGLGAHPAEVQSALKLLESAGHLERRRGAGSDFVVLTRQVGPGELAVPFDLAAQRVARERQMLDRLVRFTDTASCRRHNLLRYFGESEMRGSCGSCDCCVGSRAPAPEAVPESARRRSGGGAAPAVGAADDGPYDERVFNALRALRTELAREGQVPPYVIFHDATLREIARALPATEQEFIAVKGLGPHKWEKFGARVLAVTAGRSDQQDHSAAAPPAASRPTPIASDRDDPVQLYGARSRLQRKLALAAPAPLAPSAEREAPPPDAPPAWIASAPAAPRSAAFALYERGLGLEEIARQRGGTVSSAAAELAEAVVAGREVDVARLLGAVRLEAIRAAAVQGDGDLVAIRKRVAVPVTLGEVRLALVTRPAAAAAS
jgi:ATP-dependent DNA helicase RecQ